VFHVVTFDELNVDAASNVARSEVTVDGKLVGTDVRLDADTNAPSRLDVFVCPNDVTDVIFAWLTVSVLPPNRANVPCTVIVYVPAVGYVHEVGAATAAPTTDVGHALFAAGEPQSIRASTAPRSGRENVVPADLVVSMVSTIGERGVACTAVDAGPVPTVLRAETLNE
jgi:hypothetical protein